MEAAFVDIGTPKNAVLYQSDLIKNASSKSNETIRIEEALKIKSQSMSSYQESNRTQRCKTNARNFAAGDSWS